MTFFLYCQTRNLLSRSCRRFFPNALLQQLDARIHHSSASSLHLLNRSYSCRLQPTKFATLQGKPWQLVINRFATTDRTYDTVCHDDNLQLICKDSNQTLKIPYIWLRDHCLCSDCFNHDTHQRSFDTFVLDLDIAPRETSINNGSVNITWQDSHCTTFDLNWLQDNAPGSTPKEADKKILWDAETICKGMPPDIPYNEFMQNDESLKQLLMNIYKYGFGIVGGCKVSEEGTTEVSRRICNLKQTLYGMSWSFTSDYGMADTAYTNLALGAHNDNTYFQDASGIQVLHCLGHDGRGGENLLVDGFKAAKALWHENPDYYKTLCHIPIQSHYVSDSHFFLNTMKLLQENPITNQIEAIRYNPYDRAIVSHLSFDDTKLFYASLQAFSKHIKSSANELWFKLTPGRVLFFDNWRLLHGRAAFDGKRIMAGCYLSRDDSCSRMRSVGLNIY